MLSLSEQGLLVVVVPRFLTAVAAFAAEHRLQVRGLRHCIARAQWLWHTGLVLHSIWNALGQG